MANPVHDSPDKTYLKVDFGTILKRRRRTPEDYIQTQGITSGKALEQHLVWLSKTYVVSDKFAGACRTYVRKLEKAAAKEEELTVALQPESEKKKKKAPKTKKRTARAKKGS